MTGVRLAKTMREIDFTPFEVPQGSRGAAIARAYNRAALEVAEASLAELYRGPDQDHHERVDIDDRGRKVRSTTWQGRALTVTLDPQGNLLVEHPSEKTVFFRNQDGTLERRWSRGGNHRHQKIFSDGRVENLFQRFE